MCTILRGHAGDTHVHGKIKECYRRLYVTINEDPFWYDGNPPSRGKCYEWRQIHKPYNYENFEDYEYEYDDKLLRL